MSQESGLWEGRRPAFRPTWVTEEKWLLSLDLGQVKATTMRGAIALATAETLSFYLSPTIAEELASYGDYEALKACDEVLGVLKQSPSRYTVCQSIWRVKPFPNMTR